MPPQPGILAPCAVAAHFLTLRLTSPQQAKPLLRQLAALAIDDAVVVGFGFPLVQALGASIPGLRSFPQLKHPGGDVPATQGDVWIALRGGDPGAVFDRVLAITRELPGGIEFAEDQPAFTFRGGRDLSGYEDGTENPSGEAAGNAAFVAEGPLAGSSFVATQRWVHDLQAFARLSPTDRDHSIGRKIEDNAEITDAPPSAHVKRSAQESFDPAAFMLRRSMPYGTAKEHGLYFVAYGADLDRFERVLRRMCGLDDEVPDALFGFSRPVTGGYAWCPAVNEAGRLDLGPILPAGGIDAIPDVEVAEETRA